MSTKQQQRSFIIDMVQRPIIALISYTASKWQSKNQNINTTEGERDKFPLKVMQINFHRAGTTSTGRALQTLGLGPAWHLALDTFSSNKIPIGVKYWINNKMDSAIMNNEPDAANKFDKWLHIINCSTIMDAPVSLHWKQIFEWYPDCKVILNVRQFDKWHKSVVQNIVGIFFTTWFTFFAQFLPVNGWLYWYLSTLTNDWHIENKQKCKQFMIEYIEDVKKIVPKDQLLIYDVSDGWNSLCEFFNCEIPKRQFPYTNDGPTLKRLTQLNVVAELVQVTFPYIICSIIAYYYFW
eukprot:356993_1